MALIIDVIDYWYYEAYVFTQPLHMARIWYKVNF